MEDNVIKFNNWEKPDKDFCTIYASQNRKSYMHEIPEHKQFKGAFIVKERLKKLKMLCDLSYGIVVSTNFGDSVVYSDLTTAKGSELKDGYVEISFNNQFASVSNEYSPTGWSMFQKLCLEADKIEIRRRNLDSASMAFYVSDISMDMVTGMGMDSNDVVSMMDAKDYWESLRNDSLAEHKIVQQAVSSAEEMMKSDEYYIYYRDNVAPFVTNSDIPEHLIDMSVFPLVVNEQNVVRDALLSLMLNHGIGIELNYMNINPEKSNRIGAFGYDMTIQNAASFDTAETIGLFKRCVKSSSSFELNPTNSSGEIIVSFEVDNIHRKARCDR